MKPQNKEVLEYMRLHRGITSLDAATDLGIMRLSARIYDLRQAGYDIHAEIVPVENRHGEKVHVARYTLNEEAA